MTKTTFYLRDVEQEIGIEELVKYFSSYDIKNYLTEKQAILVNNQLWSKEKLAKKIIKHYYMEEIGFETIPLFKLKTEIHMEEIMEENLPILYSNYLEYNPLSNVDYTETFNRTVDSEATNTGSSNSNSNNTASGLVIGSNTPQKNINKKLILDGKFASNTSANENESKTEDSTKVNNEGTSKNVEEYTRRIVGNNSALITNQKLIEQFRGIIIAVDKKIIEECNPLFLGLY